MRLKLRSKLLIFAIAIGVAPLYVVGQHLIEQTRDELKSAANDGLVDAASILSREIDANYLGAIQNPLLLIRNAVDNPQLDVREKISLLQLGHAEIPGVVALQLTVAGSQLPVLAADQRYSERLRAVGDDPVKTLRIPAQEIAAMPKSRGGSIGEIIRLSGTGDWLATVLMQMESKIRGSEMTLSARIDLSRIGEEIAAHPFNRRGRITVVDREGQTVFESEPRDLSALPIVQSALGLLRSAGRTATAMAYVGADGRPKLGAFAFPQSFPWVIITELDEASAYAIVSEMSFDLGVWIAAGVLVSILAAFVFALRLSRPIVRVGEAAERVSQGNFKTQVVGVQSRDEIGELADRMNTMIRELGERCELMKFVSRGTVSAVQSAAEGTASGVSRGGERRRVTMLFSDIRGYTAFTETVDPETVVEMLKVVSRKWWKFAGGAIS